MGSPQRLPLSLILLHASQTIIILISLLVFKILCLIAASNGGPTTCQHFPV
jgi:hypothetical protein